MDNKNDLLKAITFCLCIILFTIIMLSGCATKRPTEVTEYRVRHYAYHDYWELQKAKNTDYRVKGFHRFKDGIHEIHTMKWNFCTIGHELFHASIGEGLNSEGHPHFKR